MCRRTGEDHIVVDPTCGSVTDMMEKTLDKDNFPRVEVPYC